MAFQNTYYGDLPSDLPEWLRQQYTRIEDDGGNARWTMNQGITTEGGERVVETGPQGQSYWRGEHAVDPSLARQDSTLGWITPESNWNRDEAHASRQGRRNTALSIFGAAAGAGLMGLGTGAPGVFGGEALGSGIGVGGEATAGIGAGAEGAGALSGAAGASVSNSLLGGPISALLEGDLAGAGTSALSWAANNPLQAAGLLQAGSGLLQGNRPSGGNGPGGGSGDKGGSGTAPAAPAMKQPEWKPNQFTMNQLQQLYGGQYG